MSKDLIIEGKVIAGDDVDTSLLLDVPVLDTESLSLAEEVSLRDLAAPLSTSQRCKIERAAGLGITHICLCCLLQVTINTHTGKTKDS